MRIKRPRTEKTASEMNISNISPVPSSKGGTTTNRNTTPKPFADQEEFKEILEQADEDHLN